MNALSGLSGLSGLIVSGPTQEVSSVAPNELNNEIQIMYFGSSSSPKTPVSGTYTLTFDSQTTSSINYNDTAATIKTALEGLSTIGSGNIDVTSVSGGFRFEFKGVLASTDVSLISATPTLKQSASAVNITVLQYGAETVNINADNQITQAALDTSEQQYPSSASNISTGTDWTNLSNITSEDGSYVSCDVASGSNSKFLQIFFNNFNIPSYATIVGVLVEIKRYKDGAGTFNESWSGIRTGVELGTNFAGSPAWSTSETFDSVGGSTELHGLTLTPDDFNTGNVKYRCRIYATGNSVQGYIDTARMTVYYKAHQIDTCSFDDLATSGSVVIGGFNIAYNGSIGSPGSGFSISGGPQTEVVTIWDDYSSHTPLTIDSNTLSIPGQHNIVVITLSDSPTEGNYYLSVARPLVVASVFNDISYNALGSDIETLLTTGGYGCTVTGDGPWTIESTTNENWTVSAAEEIATPLLKSLGVEIIVSQTGHS
jgi:hypothetical protein